MVHRLLVESIRGAVKPDESWIVNGVPATMDQLRALGKAIDIRPAAPFIGAALGCRLL